MSAVREEALVLAAPRVGWQRLALIGGIVGIGVVLVMNIPGVADVRRYRSGAAVVSHLAVSRQREYLADASSVELTRNPHGLERALAKIASDKDVLEVASFVINRDGCQKLHVVLPGPIGKV